MILLLLPAGRLDLFHENYSTLSMNVGGRLYLLAVCLSAAVLLYLETRHIGAGYALITAAATAFSTLIPHHVPYDIQGNLHLFLAYACSFVIVASTYRGLFVTGMKKAADVFTLLLMVVPVSYMRHMMVTLFAETVMVWAVLIFNLLIFLRTSG